MPPLKKKLPGQFPAVVNLSFRQIAETANDVIIITGPDLDPPGPTIVYVNPAFVRLTGFTAEEAVGATPRILQGPGTSRVTLGAIGVALREGRHVHEKVLNFAKHGAPYWLDLRIVPLRDEAGAVTHFAAIERDVTMDKRRLDELEYIADRDTLTGIPNRRAFLRALEETIEAAEISVPLSATSKGPALAMIDIDHFKKVNDVLGHLVGDSVLFAAADRLTENIRRVDMLGRIGGEEFAVCMPAVSLGDAEALAERLRRAVAAAPVETPGGPVSITVSIGVTVFNPGDSLRHLMERADMALYGAKRAGRNRVRAQGVGLAGA